MIQKMHGEQLVYTGNDQQFGMGKHQMDLLIQFVPSEPVLGKVDSESSVVKLLQSVSLSEA